jgi:hypothetical protein
VNLVDIISWAGTLVVLGSYFWSIHSIRPQVFAVGNVIGAPLLALPTAAAGLWGPALVSATFGGLGIYGLLKGLK